MITYDIFDEVGRLRDVFDVFFKDSELTRRGEFPYINLYEKENDLIVKALLPGIKAEDLELQLVDNSLIIEGEKKADYTDNAYIRKERLFGKFKRSIKLPYRVDGNSIKADLKEGILTVSLTKSEDAKPKKIEIK